MFAPLSRNFALLFHLEERLYSLHRSVSSKYGRQTLPNHIQRPVKEIDRREYSAVKRGREQEKTFSRPTLLLTRSLLRLDRIQMMNR